LYYYARIGRNSVEELKSHAWFDGLDWNSLRSVPAPYLPDGSAKMRELLGELRTVDSDSPRYGPLLQQITANFDDFKDDGTVWGKNANNAANSSTNAATSKSSGQPRTADTVGVVAAGEQGQAESSASTMTTSTTAYSSPKDEQFIGYTFKRKKVS
jgi:hypothetical protein